MNINGKEVELSFGLRFLEEAQKLYCPNGVTVDGQLVTMNIGYGANRMALHLKSGQAPAIGACIQCATAHMHEMERPTYEDMDAWIVEQVGKGKSIAQLCGDFLSLLLNAPLCREGVQQYLKLYDLSVQQLMLEKQKEAEQINSQTSEKTATSSSASSRKRKSTGSNTRTT